MEIGSAGEKSNGIDTIGNVLVIKLAGGFARVHCIILLCTEYLRYQIIHHLRENSMCLLSLGIPFLIPNFSAIHC